MNEEVIGVFSDGLDSSLEGLTLVFSPATASRTRRWRNNGLSADFLGDYVATFFPGDDDTGARASVKNMVSYVANELLENALKYHDGAINHPISVRLLMRSDALLFVAANAVSAEQGERYARVARELAGGDVADYYARRLESAVPNAGVGLCSLVVDYSAEIGWRFSETPAGLRVATTSVRVAVADAAKEDAP